MEYVRFVSKRGTVAGFRPLEGDRAHRAHICVRIDTSPGMNFGCPAPPAESDPAAKRAMIRASKASLPPRDCSSPAPISRG